MHMAFTAHQPRHGRITVHPTPLASNSTGLAHDIIRALGKHLPCSGDDGSPSSWTGNISWSWLIAATWTLTLGITNLTVCRAHLITAKQWSRLLALSARTGIGLTLLCNGPLPGQITSLLATIPHSLIDNTRAAADHWRPLPGPSRLTIYPWWQHHAPFPPREDELWFRTPPQPQDFSSFYKAQPAAEFPRPSLPLQKDQDPAHPHTAQVADRIHTRIAHPVHAAYVAAAVVTGFGTKLIAHRYAYRLLPAMPAWAAVFTDAARQLADLQGQSSHSETLNPLSIRRREHLEIDRRLQACRILRSPPPAFSRCAIPPRLLHPVARHRDRSAS
jgi:hypothetical protein